MGRSLLILLDTHVVLWLGLDPNRVSRKATAAIDQARRTGEGLAISAVTLLELARLSAKKEVQLNASLESFLAEVERIFVVLPITSRICIQTVSLPASYPKDPLDRVIGATALVEGLTLVTADAQIRNSRALRTIW
jgi:PIN domain nuclease of toxin-antitoxin system